jgi:hypothetical protein
MSHKYSLQRNDAYQEDAHTEHVFDDLHSMLLKFCLLLDASEAA